MKQFDFSVKAIFSHRICPIMLTMLMALGMSVSLFAQTTTRYNDGYLTIFKVAAPAGASFTLSGTTTLSSATVTFASTTGIAVGMSITGTGIAANTSVLTVVNSTTITISTNATAAGTNTLTFNAALNTGGTAIIAEEYLPTGAAQSSPNYSLALPTTSGAPNKRIVTSGSGASVGGMTRSENGRYLTVPGYDNNVGVAAASYLTAAMRTIDGTGNVGAGIQGTFHTTGAANFRSTTSDDGVNFWTAGSGTGILYSNNGTTVTTVSTTQTNTRVINIYNSQLYYTTGSATIGLYKVGTGKPTTTGTTSTIQFTLNASNLSPYGFSVSPDGNTVYIVDDGASKGIFRYTFDGTTWSGGTLIFTGTGYTGLTVDWTTYSYNATAGNGAKIYACNPTTLTGASDNGTTAVVATTLRTLTGLNSFRQLAFSPIKQTVSKGANTPAAGNVTANTTNNAVFQFNLSADEGNSTMKKVVVNNSGTASLTSDFANIRLYDDVGTTPGAFDVSDVLVSTGSVSGSNITFSIASPVYITQGSSKNYLVVADVTLAASSGGTLIPGIVTNKTVNATNYTTNLFNAGGSYVTIGATAPTGNTISIIGTTPAIALSSPSQIGNGNLTQGTIDAQVSAFEAAVTLAGTTLNTVSFTIGNGGGTYTAGNVSNFKLYYGTTSTFASAIQIGSTFNSSATASGGTVTFSSLSQSISNNTTGYLWVLASVNGSAIPGDKFNVSVPTLTFSAGSQSGTISAGGNQTILLLTPTITLANGTIGAGTITQNTINNVLYRTDVTVSTTNAILNSASFVTAGTYSAGDVSNFKLWYSTNATFSTGTATAIGTLSSSLGAGTQTFSGLSQAFTNGATAYLYVTTDLPCGSFNGVTIDVNAITNSSLTFASGTPTGSGYTAGGTQTISSPTNNITGLAATNGDANSVVSWTNPAGCYNEVMIVVAPASNTGTPSGDGSTYTANLTYPLGTALGNGRVVYKGSTSPQTISGLTNNSTYSIKIFTRNGTNWSAGVEVNNIAPVAAHFTAGNLAVEAVGTGGALSSTATVISIREYSTTGTLTNTFVAPNATTGSLPTTPPFYAVESGSATSAGQLNRSADGAFLMFPGYNALTGQTSVVATAVATSPSRDFWRVMGQLNQGTNTVSASFSTSAYNFFSASTFRSIASNGYSFWPVGTVTGGAGLYYLKDANSTPVSLGSVNTRVAKIFNNTLYYSTASTNAAGIFQVATNGLPISTKDISLVRLTDASYANTTTNGSSPYAFDINPAGNVMYIADDNSTFVNAATQKGGIIKYTKSGSTWSFAYTLQSPVAASGARGLVVDWTTANPTIYFTTSTSNNNVLAKIVDAGTGSTGTALTSAVGTGYALRGIALAPVAITGAQLTCTANLLPFGGEPVGFTTLEKVFNVAGTGFTGNMTVTAPVTSPVDQYGVSLTSGGPYTSSVTIPGGSPANTTVYMVLQPTAIGTYNGNLTISATGATDLLVPVTGKGIIPVNYYNVSGADVTKLVNWGTNTDGSGTKPTDFTSDGQYFNITNTPIALASSATTAVIDQGASTASGSPTLTFTGVPTCNNSPQSLFVGAVISGANIPAGTTILSTTANTITMSANATATDNSGTVVVSVAVSGPWTITGSLSKIVVGNGINFIIPTTRAYSGTADVAANGTLTLQNNTIPTLGVLDVASTVNYNQTGAATVVIPVNPPDNAYGNLTLQGTALDGRTLPTGSYLSPFNVYGSLNVNNVTVSGAANANSAFMTLGGNLTMSNGAVMVAATPTTIAGLLSVITYGNNNQTYSYTGGGTIRLGNLYSTKTAGIMTLGTNTTLLSNYLGSPTAIYSGTVLNFSGSASFVSQSGSSLNATGSANIHLNFTGSSTFTLGGSINADDNSSTSFGTTPASTLITNFPTGTSFNDGGNSITVAGSLGMGGAAGSYTLSGTQTVATQTGASTIGDNALNGTIVPTLKNFTFAPAGGTGTIFAGSNGTVNIAGNFLISSAGTATTNKINGGSNTINIGGDFTDQRTIDMVLPGTATWTFNGSVAQTFSTAYTSGESFYNAELANSAGLTMTTGDIKIGASGNLTCSSGILTTGSNKIILNATAFVLETVSSYILGNVQTTRTLNTFAEAFGGIGLSISAGVAPGATTVLRNTGTSNAIGCVNKSVKRTFTITNSGTSLNANVAFSFVPANELNGLSQPDLELYDVTGNTVYANSSINTNTITKTGLATIGGTYSASIAAPTITASATADAVCFSTSSQNANLDYTAITGNVTTYSITWTGTAPAQGFINVTDAAIVASPISLTVPANAVANTYNGSISVKNSSACTSSTSPFTLMINPLLPPSVALSLKTGNNPTCDGGSVVLQATPTNGGTLPVYQWFKNGSPVSGNSTDTLLVTNITSTTTVYAVMTVGTGICVTMPTATSATTTINTVANSWTGAFSNNWFDKRNWCANAVPSANIDVFVPVTSRNPVVSGSTNGSVDNINIATGAAITITNVTLVVSRTVTGTGSFSGNGGLTLANNGSVGTLYFGAGGIKTLKITGTGASASLGNATSVYGELNIGSAILSTGGNLTLKSDNNGTANVAPITGSGNITGNVTVERYIPQNAFRAWRLLSVPVQTGGTQSTFKTAWQENQAPMVNGIPGFGVLLTSTAGGSGYDAATSGNSLLSFNSGSPGTFTAVSNTNNAMATNSGYFVYVRGNRSASLSGGTFNPSATTLRTNGPLYIGTRPAITLPAGTNVMVGNQYASAIDFDLMTKSGVTGFSVWDPKIAGTYNLGAYNTYSTLTGWSINGGSYIGATAGRIESGQAFIVNSTTGGSITLTEAAKVTGSRNVFKTNTSLQVLRTKLYATTPNGSELADGNAIVFGDAFSNGTDDADMIKPTNIGENLGIKNGSILAVEGRSIVTSEDIIDYAISNLKAQQYSLEFSPENMDPSLTAYLEDRFAGSSTPVSMTSATIVKFTITSNAASSAMDRFRIVFKAAPQAAATTVAAKVVNNNGKSNVVISWKNAAEKGVKSYEIEHSTDGVQYSKIATTTAKGNTGAEATYTATDEAANNGDNYYRIKVVSTNSSVVYSNVVKVQITRAVEITVYPNPVMDGNMNVHFANAAKGGYTASIINKSGQTVMVQTLSISEGSSVKTMRLSAAIPAGSYQLKVQQPDGKTIVQTIIVGDK